MPAACRGVHGGQSRVVTCPGTGAFAMTSNWVLIGPAPGGDPGRYPRHGGGPVQAGQYDIDPIAVNGIAHACHARPGHPRCEGIRAYGTLTPHRILTNR